MRKFNLKKRLSSVAVLPAIALIIGGSVYAAATFGPSRPTFTVAHPATYITFNSITDNSVWGDERYLLKSRDLNSPTTAYATSTAVTDNEDVVLAVYFHNNAASNLNLVAHNTTVRIHLPSGAATSQVATGYITASNATPNQVWSTADLTSSKPFTLTYEPGTAKLTTNFVSGVALSDNVVTTGTQVGSHGADGDVPGCSQYSGYVTIRAKVQVQQPTPPPPPPTPTPQPQPQPKPAALPNTGPGDVAEMFVGTSVFGTLGHYFVSRRRK